MFFFFFFNDTATTEIYTLSLHDALPIGRRSIVCFAFDSVLWFCPMETNLILVPTWVCCLAGGEIHVQSEQGLQYVLQSHSYPRSKYNSVNFNAFSSVDVVLFTYSLGHIRHLSSVCPIDSMGLIIHYIHLSGTCQFFLSSCWLYGNNEPLSLHIYMCQNFVYFHSRKIRIIWYQQWCLDYGWYGQLMRYWMKA